MNLPGVEWIDMHQCQFGQQDEHGNPVKKPTRWLSNSKHILNKLNAQCQGRGGWCVQGGEWRRHTPCYGKVATAAAIYPFKLCKAILEGLAEEMKERGRRDMEANLILPPTHRPDDDQVSEREEITEDKLEEIKKNVMVMYAAASGKPLFIDATTGQVLDERFVRKARLEEMVYFRDKNVYTKVPREESFKHTGKPPIEVKWVDVNKGDDEAHNYWSRLVAKDFLSGRKMTASSPPRCL